MKKKYGKYYLVIIIAIVALLFTWIYPSVTCSDVCEASKETVRAGIMDFFTMIYFSFYYRMNELFLLFAIGGCYGVLSQTKAYRKMIDKVSNFVEGRELISTLVVTLVMGLYAAFCDQLLVLLIFVPFIITVYLKAGRDRITALMAAFGGMFIGTSGAILGTHGIAGLALSMGLNVSTKVGVKIVMFIMSYVLFNLFAWFHMKKQTKLVDSTKYDMFTTEELDEKGVKKYNKVNVWPTAILMIVCAIIALLAFVNWKESFNVTLFSDSLTKFKTNADFLYHVVGDVDAFGDWTYIALSGVLVLFTLVIGLINGRKEFLFHDFGKGMKKITKVAVMFGLVQIIFTISFVYGWAFNPTIAIIGTKFNVIKMLIAAMFISFFAVDPTLITYVLGLHFVTLFSEKLFLTSFIFTAGYSIIQVIAPTSFLLMIALTYLNVPYTKWLKEIWKYALCLLLMSIIIALVI